ncbi:nitric oxide reductase transcriptional regulator NorR [Pseudomonas sp. TKO26]|uniref:nitric oxide reductase transcriptional regulator NorR n=1 Tax=unclassified Pseudomonas TaxID=196821 RepID=UPI000D9B0176|nr:MULTISPECIES: nitric oxide reductase transcriptional regulator NorR [unclassified Pseudomonas]PYY92142.1 nitric oxide reductase transcriptional regulator NorR [Pseudomonas sp. TKO30]PYY94505.1 nitric oxide reductase transcriptional regulator NorR [Pseudomonas sp. TKO29]PYY96378.1 nitric oxide reductase transcriptional regulator NorR [Pseudomonas sp. TKO26]PYZ01970.1 nitric oxide reductase transcriptional regulator NorR [Pseudomonas sp. TKO14]
MTAKSLLTTLLPLVSDLSRELPEGERYRRLLEALRALLPCDAAALLRLDGQWLVPLAVDGLSTDTLGRRFKVSEHPRFAALLASPGPTRFASDSELPDPYDGLVEGLDEHLEVHDCMGCPLFVDERPWGLLTLDALDPQRFEPIELDALQAFASLAAATVSAAERIERLALRAENEHQRAEVYRQASGQQREMIGQSKAHKRLLEEISLVGGSDLTVLITGETGVGKELVAQAIHAASPRAEQPLISLNCAALPDTLVESELFGHVRGAFTGATQDRRGKFELANGGTLFLDEVGELSLTVQAKLLRVLQSGQLQRLGSDKEHQVDVRLIAATNRDLAEEVRSGRYRADFYHRLSVYPLRVPALRDRGRDVLLLSGYFLEQNRSRMGLGSLRLSADAQQALLGYNWPGNVRELEHLIGRSALKALGNCRERPRILSLDAADLDLPGLSEKAPTALAPALESLTPAPLDGDLRQATERYQRQLINACLERHQHNWAGAARELGLDRANLSRLAKRLGLR